MIDSVLRSGVENGQFIIFTSMYYTVCTVRVPRGWCPASHPALRIPRYAVRRRPRQRARRVLLFHPLTFFARVSTKRRPRLSLSIPLLPIRKGTTILNLARRNRPLARMQTGRVPALRVPRHAVRRRARQRARLLLLLLFLPFLFYPVPSPHLAARPGLRRRRCRCDRIPCPRPRRHRRRDRKPCIPPGGLGDGGEVRAEGVRGERVGERVWVRVRVGGGRGGVEVWFQLSRVFRCRFRVGRVLRGGGVGVGGCIGIGVRVGGVEEGVFEGGGVGVGRGRGRVFGVGVGESGEAGVGRGGGVI
ncbi:hypothetical protein DFH09DRAFT_447520 [Mycena vulgaris]|nr:hypothetical protein DFH09DRAFT_447482 [Mycena vulgaris]KAJ6602406.1 hypothetical protein DFH09DRAFT_447520 [Mycena vulgaris]